MHISQERESSFHPVEKYWDAEYWQALKEKFGVPDFDHFELIDVHSWLKEIPFKEIALQARKDGVRIEGGGLPEKLNRYLNMLIFLTGGPPGRVGKQFIARPEYEQGLVTIEGLGDHRGFADSLIEEEHEVAPGVIHKYPNRVLFIVTGQCAAYCRYCTRGRLVGIEGAKTKDEIDQGFAYIQAHPEIKEIIYSGGDAFIVPKELFIYMIDKAQELFESGQLRSIRFGTRSIIHNPDTLQDWHLEQLSRLFNMTPFVSPNVMLHYNHPYELTLHVAQALKKLYQAGARVHSQTVLLGGVNDDPQILEDLEEKGHMYGVNGYYTFYGDDVRWGKGFFVPAQRAQEIAYQRRSRTMGLAGRSRLVFDVPNGHGKIAADEGFWINKNRFRDFKGDEFEILAQGMIAPYNGE